MITPTSAFRTELNNGNRNYLISVYLYSSSGTYLITDAQVWERTLTFEDTVNSDDVFDVGNAIINKFTMGLNNINEQYSNVVFKDAVVIPSIGLLVNGQPEMLQKGIYIVEDTKYDGAIIKLACLDLMERFDRPYETNLTFPATLRQIVNDAITQCGITINNTVYPLVPDTFPSESYQVAEKPTKESLSFREVISWCAQIGGCFARVSRLGKLEIKWFDTAKLAQIQDVIDADPVPVHTDVNNLYECFSTDVAVHETEVTGVRVTYQITESDGGKKVHTATEGDIETFKVEITDNDFISTDAQAVTVASTVSSHVVGMKFFRAEASHLSDPCIEAGDIGIIRNFRGNYYPIIISRTKFGISVSQNTNSNAETDSKNTSYRDIPAISISTDFPEINIPTDLIVITAPDGEDWAIYIDDTGVIHTVKVPKRIYYYVEPKTEYIPGDEVDVSYAEVHAVYNDGTEIDVTAECTFDPEQGFEIPAALTGTFPIVATWTFTPGTSSGGGS